MSSETRTPLSAARFSPAVITIVAFMVVIAAVSSLMLVSYRHMSAMQAGIEEITENFNRKAALVHSMGEAINQRMTLVRDIMLESDAFKRDGLLQKYFQYAYRFNHSYSELTDLELSKEEQQHLEQIITRMQQSASIRRRVEALVADPSPPDKGALLSTAITLHQVTTEQLNTLTSIQRNNSRHQLQIARRDYRETRNLLGLIFIGILGMTLVIAVRVSRYIRNNSISLSRMAHDKSMLLATMSHEIRTPLTSIIGFGESLLDTDTTKEERIGAIQAIVRNGRHLQGVINNVLDYSKLDSQQMEISNDWVELKPCLDDLQNMFRSRAQAKGLKLEIRSMGPLPARIQTDEMRLRQILINLMNNAIKFTDEGEVVLGVGFDTAEGSLSMQVRDTGVGMSEEQIHTLFTPYRQVGMAHKQEGTGLGLFISRQMAELMSGALTVRSKPGEGSCFTLTIPAGDVADVERIEWSGPLFEAVKGAVSRAVQLRGRVLLAEDLKDNQKLFSIYMEKAGVDLTIVENGREAVDEALKRNYSLVLMDMQMPVMDGVSATRELRAMGYDKPIIALTANNSQSERQTCQDAGFDGFLSKPINRAAFISVLTRYLAVNGDQPDDADTPIHCSLLEEMPDLQPAVDYFISQLPEKEQAIELALEREDWDAFKELVHDLKGTAGGVGYAELTQLAMEIEFALAKEDLDEVDYLVGCLSRRIDRVQRGYVQQRQEGGASQSNGVH